MTDVSLTTKRTRRAVLTAAAGAVAATAAEAIARPLPAAAAGNDGTAIAIGGFYPDARSQTTLANNTTGEILLWVASNTGSFGASGTGQAIVGYSAFNIGVQGQSGTNLGVHGLGEVGVKGDSAGESGSYGVWGVGQIAGVYGDGGAQVGTFGTGGTYGVQGLSTGGTGVYGTSSTSIGARGDSGSGVGVYGHSLSNHAVQAESDAGSESALLAHANGGSTGVVGLSGAVSATSPAKVGVYGAAAQDSTARGVLGITAAGTGLHGWTGAGAVPGPSPQTGVYGRCDIGASSRGVSGYSATGTGMWGNTASGTGLYGAASSSTGYALKTSGKLAFGKVSGVTSIAAGAFVSSAIATGTDVTTSSYVLVTPQADPGTRRFWATLDTTNNTITLHTNATAASAIKVAWLLVG